MTPAISEAMVEVRKLKLTMPQRVLLRQLAEWKMPASFAKNDWPGFPEGSVDQRTVHALANRGLAETGFHQYRDRHGELRGGPWWRITNAGRAILETLGATP